jgi:hypothetical protein
LIDGFVVGEAHGDAAAKRRLRRPDINRVPSPQVRDDDGGGRVAIDEITAGPRRERGLVDGPRHLGESGPVDIADVARA